MLVAPALPTNDPKNSWSTGGGLGRKLRFAAVRAMLQVHILCKKLREHLPSQTAAQSHCTHISMCCVYYCVLESGQGALSALDMRIIC